MLIMFITISAVLFEDAVILGAASDGVTYKPPSEDTKKSVQNLPFCIVERTVSCLTFTLIQTFFSQSSGKIAKWN